VNDELKNSETILVGSWIKSGEKIIGDENCQRIEHLKSNYLIKVTVEQIDWEVLYQDPNDKRYWLLTYPHSDWHGGGPPTLKMITLSEVNQKFGIN